MNKVDNFHKNVYRLMKEKNITEDEVWKKCAPLIHESYYLDFDYMGFEALIKVSELLGYTIDYLINSTVPKEQNYKYVM
jgi:hypothetical protein